MHCGLAIASRIRTYADGDQWSEGVFVREQEKKVRKNEIQTVFCSKFMDLGKFCDSNVNFLKSVTLCGKAYSQERYKGYTLSFSCSVSHKISANGIQN